MRLYKAHNGAMATTAAPVAVTTGTAIKTMLQIAPPSTSELKAVMWAISFDGSAAATPIKVELIETDVAATVTAFVAADISKHTDPGGIASQITLGTAASGYTASAEGTITSTRMIDGPYFIAPTNQYPIQFPLGQEGRIQAGKFLRVRVTAAAAVNCYTFVIFGE